MTLRQHPQRVPQNLEQIFAAQIQLLGSPYRYYRVAADRFLAYLQTDFPHLRSLSELRRDPHLLGWIRGLGQQDPPLSHSTRRIYLACLRRLLRDLAPEGQSALILPQDFPPAPARPHTAPKKGRRPQAERSRLNESLFRTHPLFGEIFDSRIRTLATTFRRDTINTYRVAARRFLSYLQADFPQVRELSELRRDPHLLGWVRGLYRQDPPLSNGTREQYLYKLWRLLQDLVAAGHSLQTSLIRTKEDFQWRLSNKPNPLSDLRFGELFDTRIQTLATTLRPSTVAGYRTTARCFLSYLQTDFPHLQQLAELRRDPHLSGWLRCLCQQEPSLSNTTRQNYLLQLRRLFEDLTCAGHPLQPGLILSEDLPPRPQYLPRALSLEDDQRLQQELRRRNDLLSNALLLTRATGLRIGECIGLAVNCLRSVGPDQWAVQVPLGKLRTERLVPVDQDVRQMVNHILVLRAQAPASQLARSAQFLLPRSRPYSLCNNLRVALNQAAQRSGCSDHVTPHRLRHTYASEMIRLGVSLPSVMKLLGHKTIRMTLRYVQVTQRDLQREFHLARQNAVHVHQVPELSVSTFLSASSDLPGILHTLAAARHLLEMYRRQLKDDRVSRTLRRLDKRLHTVALQLDRLATAAK
jgi:site-specific recombinase XerD